MTTEKKVNSGSSMWFGSVPKLLNLLILVLSLGLIVFISVDTYRNVDYLENSLYMRYQFFACLVFIAEYFYRLCISRHKWRFMFLALPFLLVSIPYLNIIEMCSLEVPHDVLSFLCFIPILRGLAALVMVVTYITRNISTTVFASYALVLLPIVYMSGLIFYVAEKDINTTVKNLWYALWWAGMNVTTIGCYINPMTNTGMVLGLILSLLGIIMLPLFTVYFGDVINRYSGKIKDGKQDGQQ